MKMKSTLTYFQEAFREWITKNDLTEKEAANIIGVSTTLINHLKNKKTSITFKMADRIAEKLNTSVYEMIGRGRTLLRDDLKTKNLTLGQIQALEAFQVVLLSGGELAEELAERAIAIAEKKKINTEDPTVRQGLRSAS